MKKYLLLLIILLSVKLNAQYTPYSFINYNPDWTHHSYVEDILEDDVQGYGLIDKLITNDYIYLLYEIDDKIWYNNGFLVEKLDRLTGELVWDYHTFERSFYNRDYPSELYLRDDGILVVSSFRQKPIENQYTIWVEANLNTWEFDDQTGVLLDTIVTDAADTNNVLLAMPVNILFPGTTQSFISLTKNRINNILSLYVSQSVRIESFDLSINGHLLKDTSIFLPFKYSRGADSKTIRLSENRIFNYRESETQSRDSFNIEITMMDNDLKVLYTKNLTDDIEEKYRELCYVGDSVFCVMQFGEQIFEGEPYRYQKLITYDFEGDIIERVSLDKEDGSPLYSINGFNVMYIEELERTFLLSFMKDETGSYWEYYMSTTGGQFELIGKTYLENIEDLFLWDFFPSVFMDWLGDSKILIHTLHLATGNNTTGTMIPAISVISLDDLRKTVSVIDEEIKKESLIYPNPALDFVSIIEKGVIYNSYEIFNTQGQKIKTGKLETERIDIGNIQQGILLIKLYDNKGKVRIQKIIKI